jgi:probable blue pigment (indigoidine) exporter
MGYNYVMNSKGDGHSMNRFLYGLLVIVTTFLMGSSFAIGKIGLGYVSPLLLVGLRFSIAGVVMALIVIQKPRPKKLQAWGKIALVGFFQTAGVMGCIFLSLRIISAGESSILTFINPLLVVILSTFLLGAKYQLSQWLGVLIGFLGVVITLGFHLQLKFGIILGFGAAVSWSISTIIVKKWGKEFNIWVLTAYQMMFGGIILLIMGVTLEQPVLKLNITSILIILWLAIMASIVQFSGWFYLLNRGDPGKTSAFLFLAPLFGVLSGWIILGEIVKWYVYIGGVCIFMGIFLVNWTFTNQKKIKI